MRAHPRDPGARLPLLEGLAIRGHRVLCRVDFNVPLADGRVADDTRIRAALPTIRAILAGQPRALLLLSHLGRPQGQSQPAYSLAPVAPVLSRLLNREVQFVPDCVGDAVKEAVAAPPAGAILLLENTRFHRGETSNDTAFAAQLASNGDVFINDAFGTAHREHASNCGLARLLPAAAGYLLAREVQFLDDALRAPDRPFVAIFGGAKVSDKLRLLERLLERVDSLLIGGGMANTFLAAQGHALGASLVETAALDQARELLSVARGKLRLPLDGRLAPPAGQSAGARLSSLGDAIPAGWQIMDIGPRTVAAFTAELAKARTVLWNGPLGVTERAEFAQGTQAIAQALAEQTERGATTIIGGGDSAAAIEQAGLSDRVTHLSTGGGASLALLAGGKPARPASARRANEPGRQMRGRPALIANWKMNFTAAEAAIYARRLAQDLRPYRGVEIVLCPDFLGLAGVKDGVAGTEILVGAQDAHWAGSWRIHRPDWRPHAARPGRLCHPRPFRNARRTGHR